MEKLIAIVLLLVSAISVACVAVPDTTDGVSILLMLAHKYGANTTLWFNQFERLGWTITLSGVQETIRNCSAMCTPIDVDETIGGIADAQGFDAIVVSTTRGTAGYSPDPAGDLIESVEALNLIREANEEGLTLYAGCAGLLVLGEAGVIEGRSVVTHDRLRYRCPQFGAECTVGGQSQLPMIDANIVTGTSGRFFAQEVPELIAWSLDLNAGSVVPVDATRLSAITVDKTDVELGGPSTGAWAVGGSRSDGALGVCAVEEDAVLVGYTWSGENGSADVLVARVTETGDVEWAKTLGGSGRDYGTDVCVSADGDILIAGYTTSVETGLEDVLVARFGVDGTAKWVRTFGSVGPDAGFGITATADGGAVVCGRTAEGTDAWSDLLVLKIDAEGEEVWSKTFGGEGLERGHAVVEGADSTLYVAGGTTSEGAAGNYDCLLLALSPDGEEIWRNLFGLAWFDVADDVTLTANGDLLMTGYGDRERSDPNNVIVVRYSPAGDVRWATGAGTALSYDYGQCGVELPSGDVLTCGGQTAEATMRNDIKLVRLTSEGEVVWESRIGLPEGNEWASATCTLASGTVLVAGHTTAAGAGLHDVLLMTVDPDWQP